MSSQQLRSEDALLVHLLAVFIEHHDGVAQISPKSLAAAIMLMTTGKLKLDASEGVDDGLIVRMIE